MSLASHAVSYLRDMFVNVLRKNRHINAEQFAYHSPMGAPAEAAPFVGLETMEPRLLLSAYTVTNALDSGAGSLRDAIGLANANAGADTIDFDGTYFNQARTITFGSGAADMEVTDALTITGPGESLLTIDANSEDRIFSITADDVTISDMTLVNGDADVGGAINIVSGADDVAIEDLTITDSVASVSGGGLFIGGTGATVTDTTISGAASTGSGMGAGGGGIYVGQNATATVEGSTISGSAYNEGGGIAIAGGATLDIYSSTITNSYAAFGGGIQAGYNSTLNVYGHRPQDDPAVTTISNNHAWFGGGVAAVGETMLEDVNFTGNNAYAGAALAVNNGPVVSRYNYFAGNRLEEYVTDSTDVGGRVPPAPVIAGFSEMGGIIVVDWNSSATFDLINSVGVGNQVETDGAFLSVMQGTVNVVNSTITETYVEGTTGAGVWIGTSTANPTVEINNSIVARNKVSDGYNSFVLNDIDGEDGTNGLLDVADYNLIDVLSTTITDDGDEANIFGTSPMFEVMPFSYQDGWGDDLSTSGTDESSNDDYGDLRLSVASPAREEGADALAVDENGVALATDMDHNDRIFSTTTVDVGAYEVQYLGGHLGLPGRPMGDPIEVTSAGDVWDPDDGFLTLREAIDKAREERGAAGAVITFADSLFAGANPTITLDTDLPFPELVVSDNIWIEGPTTAGDVMTIDASDTSRIFAVVGENVTIRDLTLKNGRATQGGSIAIISDLANIENVTILDSHAGILGNNTAEGGGIYVDLIPFQVATISQVTIDGGATIGNPNALYGGGIYLTNGGEAKLTDVTIKQTGATWGGGIYTTLASILTIGDAGDPDIVGVDIDGCLGVFGGGLYTQGPTTITNSTFQHNQAWIAGAIWTEIEGSGKLTVSWSEITKNNAYNFSAFYIVEGEMVLEYSYMTGNRLEDGGGVFIPPVGSLQATEEDLGQDGQYVLIPLEQPFGGGMSDNNWDGKLQILNSVITGNQGEVNGSAIGIPTGTLIMRNSTLAHNRTDGTEGGGLWVGYPNYNPTVELYNNILWGNEVQDEANPGTYLQNDIHGGGGTGEDVDKAYNNLIGVMDNNIDAGGDNLIGTSYDPKFVETPDDGGDGWGDDLSTALPTDEGANDNYEDLRLQETSPAIDAGDRYQAKDADDVLLGPDAVDLDGPELTDESDRFVDIPGVGTRGQYAIDMGAYEFYAYYPNGDFNDDGRVDDLDIDLLADAIRNGLDGPADLALFDLSNEAGTAEDGVIDVKDLDYLVRKLVEVYVGGWYLGTQYGDANLDGLVNTTDLTILAANYGGGDPNDPQTWRTWSQGNFNRNLDMEINNTDLTILATYTNFDRSQGQA